MTTGGDGGAAVSLSARRTSSSRSWSSWRRCCCRPRGGSGSARRTHHRGPIADACALVGGTFNMRQSMSLSSSRYVFAINLAVNVPGAYCRPQCSNGLPIQPAACRYCQRQTHSWCRLDGLFSTLHINGVPLFRQRIHQTSRGTYGGPCVLLRHPTPRLSDNLLRWRFELPVSKSQH